MCGASLLRERSSVWQSLCSGTPPEAIRETPASLQQGSLLGFRPGWDYRPPQQGPAYLVNDLHVGEFVYRPPRVTRFEIIPGGSLRLV